MDINKNILVLGGGFGGIKTALELSKDPGINITLISDQDNFRYYPTLYHAATGGKITASQIPLSEIFEGKRVKLIKDSAKTLDRSAKQVATESGKKYAYDELVISLGVMTNYFGIKGLEEYAYGIKSIEEAKRLRDHLHDQLLDEGKPDLNYVIIGGGPTGVELAGALTGYLRQIMQRHDAQKHSLHIDLVEAAPRLVPRMPERYSRAVARRLRKLDIKLHLGKTVEAETADQLFVSGHSIKSHTVVWTAGVANHPFFKVNGFTLSDHGKVVVDNHLQAEEHIYVIGDNADTPYSGMAQTAIYDARFVAEDLKCQLHARKRHAYEPKKPIYATPVGSHWSAVLWGRLQLYGRSGWLLRILADFVGFKDYESWPKASKHWLDENLGDESDCHICAYRKRK